jgi:hypothetical protein
MEINTQTLETAARKLHGFMLKRHWDGKGIIGPDYGIRLNYRVWRFVKSYLPAMPWGDNMYYMQSQGYWVWSNWMIAERFNDENAARVAEACTAFAGSLQYPDGYWTYPNPEWRGRIATVEGAFACIAMAETYQRTGDPALREKVDRWYRFVVEKNGFQKGANGVGHGINYFANVKKALVPNNSCLALRAFALFSRVFDDARYLEHCAGMVDWLLTVQKPSGELPYTVGNEYGKHKPHFLCYQYNGFEMLELADYLRFTGDTRVIPLIDGMARYLSGGVLANGAVRYNCDSEKPDVLYYAGAVAAALREASVLGVGDYHALADRVYAHILSHQNPDGGLAFFSQMNYKILHDWHAYPRADAFVLNHLLRGARPFSQPLARAAAPAQSQPELVA